MRLNFCNILKVPFDVSEGLQEFLKTNTFRHSLRRRVVLSSLLKYYRISCSSRKKGLSVWYEGLLLGNTLEMMGYRCPTDWVHTPFVLSIPHHRSVSGNLKSIMYSTKLKNEAE